MTNRTITEECEAWIQGKPLEGVLWYLQENRDEIDVWAESFKQTFCEMVDSIKKEISEN